MYYQSSQNAEKHKMQKNITCPQWDIYIGVLNTYRYLAQQWIFFEIFLTDHVSRKIYSCFGLMPFSLVLHWGYFANKGKTKNRNNGTFKHVDPNEGNVFIAKNWWSVGQRAAKLLAIKLWEWFELARDRIQANWFEWGQGSAADFFLRPPTSTTYSFEAVWS